MNGTARSTFEVWDTRECVSRHSSALDAHRTILGSRHVSPDSGRRLTLFDPSGRIAGLYIDGREQVGEHGSAFPQAVTTAVRDFARFEQVSA